MDLKDQPRKALVSRERLFENRSFRSMACSALGPSFPRGIHHSAFICIYCILSWNIFFSCSLSASPKSHIKIGLWLSHITISSKSKRKTTPAVQSQDHIIFSCTVNCQCLCLRQAVDPCKSCDSVVT